MNPDDVFSKVVYSVDNKRFVNTAVAQVIASVAEKYAFRTITREQRNELKQELGEEVSRVDNVIGVHVVISDKFPPTTIYAVNRDTGVVTQVKTKIVYRR